MRTQPDALSSLALRAPAPGLHALAAGQARRWCASRSGELRVARGSLWITFDGPQPGTEAGPQGDLFLHAGERLAVPAGASVVIEPTNPFDQNTLTSPPEPIMARRKASSARASGTV